MQASHCKPLGVPIPDIFRITPSPKIESTGMNEQSFDDVVMPPQVEFFTCWLRFRPHVGEASFDSLTTLTQQALAALASDPPTVLINRCLLFFLADPVPASAVPARSQ